MGNNEYSMDQEGSGSNKPETEKKPKGGTMAEEKVEVNMGAFISSLKRNNAKIREDRAIAISETAQMIYKRTVEDLEMDIKSMKRDRENALDLSPTDAQSLVLASDFNSVAFTKKDIDLGVKIRNAEITLEIAKARYEYLFGKE